MTAVPSTPTVWGETLPAGADLSDSQFRFVKRSGDTYVAVAADTDLPDGVLQNEPESGEPCHVIAFGGTKLEAAEALSIGGFVGPSANGRGAARTKDQTNTKYICGRALAAVTAGGEITAAVIDCINPTQGA